MEQHALENVNNCLNINTYFFIETSGGQSSYLYLNAANFFTPVLIKHLLQFKTVVFLHWCLICAVLLLRYLNKLVFATAIHFHPCLIFTGKDGVYQSQVTIKSQILN